MPNDNNKGGGFGEKASPRAVSLNCQVVNKVNFASAQNDVAIIELFAIDNPTDEPLVDVRVTLRAVPPIIREKIWSVDRIAQGSDLALRDLSTPLDIERLAGLDEAEVGELEFRVEARVSTPSSRSAASSCLPGTSGVGSVIWLRSLQRSCRRTIGRLRAF